MIKLEKINAAKDIIADIFNLTNEDGNGEFSLIKATDTMYEYINDIYN